MPKFGLTGDSIANGAVDIVDALLVAQYYAELNPQGIDLSAMDTSGDNLIDLE